MNALANVPSSPIGQGRITAAARVRPFDGAVYTLRVDPAFGRMPSIAEIVAAIPGLPAGFAEICEARINGDLIHRGCWHLVRPRAIPGMDTAVTFTVPLAGGGGGGGSKSTIALVATIAVLLAAAAVSGGALGVLGFSAFGAGTIAASVAGAAIGIGGALAIAALIPPPTLSPNQQQQAAISANPLLSASIANNVLAPFAPVPRVCSAGMRIYPPIISPVLVELIGDVEYAEAVIGLAGLHSISDIRVGGVSADQIAELEYEVQEGKQDSPTQSLVTRQGYTAAPAAEMRLHVLQQSTSGQYRLLDHDNPSNSVPLWTAAVSRVEPDEIWFRILWSEGLSYDSDVVGTYNQAIRVRIRIRGTTTWIYLPEVHFSSARVGPFQKDIRLIWGTIPLAPAGPPNTGSFPAAVFAFNQVPAQTATPAGTIFQTDASFSASGSFTGTNVLSASRPYGSSDVTNVELYLDKAIIYLDPNVFPQGTYEIEVIGSQLYKNSNFTPTTYHDSTIGDDIFDYFGYWTAAGDSERPGAARTVLDQQGAHSKITLRTVASVWNENPLGETKDFATISLRVHSRALDQVSVNAAAYVPDWDGSNWSGLNVTSNPAPHFRDVLTGTLGGSPLPAELIDDTALIAWRTDCITNGYTVDAIFEGKTYIDVLNVIASCGFARLRHNEKWGVFQDKDRSAESPIQVFTPRNMRNFAWTRAFAKRPSGFRAIYLDGTNNFQQAETIIYDDPVNPDSTRLEQIQYDGLVDASTVTTRGTFDLLQSKLRFTFYKGQTDLEALVSDRGSLVAVQHDTLDTQAGFARIKSIVTASGNVTGLVLEGTIPVLTELGIFATSHLFEADSIFNLGASTGIAIRLKGGNGVLTKEINVLASEDDEVSTITFATPFADPGPSQLAADCLIASGRLGSEYRRLIVYGVRPNADMTADVTFVDEAPELWQ